MYMGKKKYFNKKKKLPFFSIITVVKNDEQKIEKTLKSVISQSYKNYEYILIDGKSKDKTLNSLKKYRNYFTHLRSEIDSGIYYAMNKGIKLAKGNVIVFVNSGDFLKKKSLYHVRKVFLKNKQYDYVFGTVKRHYTTSTILKHGVNIKRLKFNFDFATAHSTGFFLKKKIFDKYGHFNTMFKLSADYDLYYRLIIKNQIKGGTTNKKNIIGEVTKGGFSSKISFIKHLIEESRIRLHNDQNVLFVIIIFINAFIKQINKKIT